MSNFVSLVHLRGKIAVFFKNVDYGLVKNEFKGCVNFSGINLNSLENRRDF